LICGVVASVAYAIAAEVNHSDDGTQASWFTNLVTPPTSMIAPGMVIAAAAVCAAVTARRAHVALGVVAAACGVPTATIGIVLSGLIRLHAIDIERALLPLIGLSIAGGLVGLASATLALVLVSPARLATWPVAGQVALALPLLAVPLGVVATDAVRQVEPSRDLDWHQVGYVHQRVTSTHSEAHRECGGEPVTMQGSQEAADAVRQLGTPLAVPATPDVRRAHDVRVTMYARCAQAIDDALRGGHPTVTPEQQQNFPDAAISTDWLRSPRF
jgi:hypothetical protein